MDTTYRGYIIKPHPEGGGGVAIFWNNVPPVEYGEDVIEGAADVDAAKAIIDGYIEDAR